MDGTITIDDGDPTVQYTGAWSLGVSAECNSSTHTPWENGAQVLLNFTGTLVSVYGTLRASQTPGKSTYNIDGGPDKTVTTPTSNEILYRQLLYQSPPLENGGHTLIITPTLAGSGYCLDYFSVTPNNATLSSSSIPPSRPPAVPSSITAIPINPSISQDMPTNPTETLSGVELPTASALVTITDPKISLPAAYTPRTNSLPTETVLPPGSNTRSNHQTAIVLGSVLGSITFLLILMIFVLRRSWHRKSLFLPHSPFGHTLSNSSSTRTSASSPPIHSARSFHKPGFSVSRPNPESLLDSELVGARHTFHKSDIPTTRQVPPFDTETRNIDGFYSIDLRDLPPQYVEHVPLHV